MEEPAGSNTSSLTPVSPAPPSTTPGLPPVKELFREAWVVFKASFLRLVLYYLMLFGLFLVIVAAATLLILIIYFLTSLLSGLLGQSGGVLPVEVLKWVSVSAAAVLFVVILIFAVSALPIGSILILNDYQQKPSLREILRRSLKLVIPLSLTGFLAGLVIFGGYFVFIIPGILFQIFFAFVSYEVVLGNRRGSAALRRSYYLVKNNFWPILGRTVLFWLLSFVLSMLLSALSPRDRTLQSPLLSLISGLISIALGMYQMVYVLTLYKQVRSISSPEEELSIRWITIVSVIGWVVALLIGLSLIRLFSSGAGERILNEIQKNLITPTPTPTPFLPTSV